MLCTKAKCHKDWFHRRQVAQIVIAAAFRVSAEGGVAAWAPGSLGASSEVLGGLQQLFQFQQNWTGYRARADALKREKYLYLARAGPYADVPLDDALLAERVEGLVSQEHAAWSSMQADARGVGKS